MIFPLGSCQINTGLSGKGRAKLQNFIQLFQQLEGLEGTALIIASLHQLKVSQFRANLRKFSDLNW